MTSIERWYAKPDRHPAVEVEKQRVRGKPRGSLWPLHAQVTLGVVLLALERVDEALAVLDEAAAAVRYTGKPSPWAIAAGAAAIALWARERRGDAIDDATRARFLKFASPVAHAAQNVDGIHDALYPWTAERTRREVADSWKKFAAEVASSERLAVDTMAFHLADVVFFRQLPTLASHVAKLPPRATDAAIGAALETIAAKVGSRR